ncbi:MAG: TonB-dependent receptor, partial [Bacteroidales bacterium]|nr:TonB-dependent receptor [Bacteroidales bacterium]
QYNLSGKILKEKTDKPIEYAIVFISDRELWGVTNEKGEFLIKNVAKGDIKITVSCLGYAKRTFTLNITQTKTDMKFYLPEDNLALSEVVVTAKNKRDEMTTTYVIDRTGLDHLQVLNVADVLSLLPGGKSSRSPHFAGSDPQTVAIRSASGESGNPTFGTAIEVDGVRLSNNGSYNSSTGGTTVYGVDTRSIASSNIESVEVITGIPSVEYGDMTSGMVKVNTRKGKAPMSAEVSFKPNTKLYAANKGFDLGQQAGVLNMSLEHTKSVADLASPYTSYDRNGLSLYYSNTLNKQHQPIRIESGITGNIGGYNSKNDPDAFTDTYTKHRDNTLRANIKLNWLLQRSWITNLEASGSVGYADNLSADKTNKSSSSSVATLHGREEGYFVATNYDENPYAPIVLIPAGYWYQLHYNDNKPLNINANIKARWTRSFGKVNSNLLVGTDFTSSGNKGKGSYYDDLRYANDGSHSWREYRFDEIPFMNNVAPYVEEKADLPIGNTSTLQAVAGIRSDMTLVRQSAYGTVSSLSPRFNAKYSYKGNRNQFVENFVLRAGWGKAVKLPSFAILYPAPSYSDKLAFAPGTMADGTTYYAYHIRPFAAKYNPELQWQYNQQTEIGFEAKIKGINISVSLFNNKMMNNYNGVNEYTPFAYKLTDQSALEGSPIPSSDRQYSIDRVTGIVTAHDKTGRFPDQTLAYKERNQFKSDQTYINGSPAVRRGIEWIVDFGKIKAIQTSVRIDGNYYYYHGTDETLTQYSPFMQFMADGNPYKYVGFYVGGSSSANGIETKQLNTNVTFVTHIPAIRLIVSLKVEATLYNSRQNLSEYSAGQRSFALSNTGDYVPATDNPNKIYNSDRFVATYPLFYASMDDLNTKIPFEEKFLWAKDNDRALYNALASLITKSNTDYYFNANKVSGYYSANISVTKEIGNFASISFNATNFTNNIGLVDLSWNHTQQTLFRSSYIPMFYYGLSLKIKI